MIRYLRESNVCEKIRLYSNGLLLTPEISDQLVNSGLDLFRISLNGLNAAHYKEFCGVSMDFTSFHDNIKYFHQVSRGKVEFAIKIANLFLDTDENKELANTLFLEHSDYFFVEDIYENWSGFEGVTTKEEHRLKQSTQIKEICTNPMTMMVIQANGLVSPCCADWKQAVTYGDVKQDAVADIWNSEAKRSLLVSLLKREEGKYPFCDSCQFDAVDKIDEEARVEILGKLES